MNNKQFQEFVIKHLMTLSEDMKSVKSDVSGLKSDVSILKSDVSGLKSDVSILKSDVSILKSDVAKIQIRMENEIIAKIQVLFDGHQQHEDRLNRLEKKQLINCRCNCRYNCKF